MKVPGSNGLRVRYFNQKGPDYIEKWLGEFKAQEAKLWPTRWRLKDIGSRSMRMILMGLFVFFPVWVLAQPTQLQSHPLQLPADIPAFNQMSVPPVPQMDWEGNPIRADQFSFLPPMDRVADLTQAGAELTTLSAKENLPAHLYWHQGDMGPFCHYVDFEGNDWVGWQEDTAFHWVYVYQGSLWAQEPMDGRWLCYSKSNWWWTTGDGNSQWSLYRNGAYYLCNADGKITDSKGNHPGELKSDYTGPFQGDSMGRQVFVHADLGAYASGHSGGHGSWAGNAGMGRVYTSQTVAWSGR